MPSEHVAEMFTLFVSRQNSLKSSSSPSISAKLANEGWPNTR